MIGGLLEFSPRRIVGNASGRWTRGGERSKLGSRVTRHDYMFVVAADGQRPTLDCITAMERSGLRGDVESYNTPDMQWSNPEAESFWTTHQPANQSTKSCYCWKESQVM
ncbi:hypothetical protein IG631_02065 [Alternaria alternata]|nr:hypothetical protein IG631_02065 [Alternaria alternata]